MLYHVFKLDTSLNKLRIEVIPFKFLYKNKRKFRKNQFFLVNFYHLYCLCLVNGLKGTLALNKKTNFQSAKQSCHFDTPAAWIKLICNNQLSVTFRNISQRIY